MTQFGAGPDFAAQCPRVTVPEGWRAWVSMDGPIPETLSQRMTALAADAPLGATENFQIPGVTTLLRVEPHAWSQDESTGELVQGCFRGVSVYLPTGAPTTDTVPPKEEGFSTTTKIIAGLTVVSLTVGIIATVRSLRKQ